MDDTELSCKHYKNNIWLCYDGTTYDTQKSKEALSTNTGGYQRLSVGEFVHRAIWQTWVGKIPTKMCINHKDGDKLNNHLDNLEMISYRQNMWHSSNVLRQNYTESIAKLSVSQVEDIVLLLEKTDTRLIDMARYYKVSANAISQINSGLNWTRVTNRKCNDYPIRSKSRAALKRTPSKDDDIVCSLRKLKEG